MLCRCGCGQNTSGPTRKFLPGHHMRLQKYKVLIGEQSSRTVKELWEEDSYRTAQEQGRNLKLKSRVMKEVWKRPGYRERVSASVSDGVSKTYRTKRGLKRRIGRATTELWKDLEYRKKQKLARETPEYQQRMSESGRETILKKRPKPNNSERALKKLLDKNFPGEFRLNVKGQVTVGGKIPDFVNVNGKKALVELFGVHWHSVIPKQTREEAERVRKNCFRKWGFKTLVVWDDVLRENPEIVLKRLKSFLESC
jgi:very-short-patch-repair endonuclease